MAPPPKSGDRVAVVEFPNAEQIAFLARLPVAWCQLALRLLAVDDVSGVVETQLDKLRPATSQPPASGAGWDEADARRLCQRSAASLYAAREIHPLILESVVLACWDSVIEHARRDRRFGSAVPAGEVECQRWLRREAVRKRHLVAEPLHRLWIQRQIGLRLGTDPTNVGRWEAFKTLPGGDKVLGAVLIALEAEFREIEFSDRGTLLSCAAARTLAFIREGRYGRRTATPAAPEPVKVDRLPTREELAAVRLALRHQDSDALVSGTGSAKREQIRDLYADVSQTLKLRRGEAGADVWPPAAVRKVIGEWAVSYALFRTALVSGWPDGTEDEWNWGDIDAEEP